MIDIVLVKKSYDFVWAIRRKGKSLSDHHIMLCKVRSVGTYIKRQVVVNGARMIRS